MTISPRFLEKNNAQLYSSRPRNIFLFIYLFIFVFLLGKFVNHKGRNRHFTNPEELEEQRRQEEEKRQWRVSIFRLTTSSTT